MGQLITAIAVIVAAAVGFGASTVTQVLRERGETKRSREDARVRRWESRRAFQLETLQALHEDTLEVTQVCAAVLTLDYNVAQEGGDWTVLPTTELSAKENAARGRMRHHASHVLDGHVREVVEVLSRTTAELFIASGEQRSTHSSELDAKFVDLSSRLTEAANDAQDVIGAVLRKELESEP